VCCSVLPYLSSSCLIHIYIVRSSWTLVPCSQSVAVCCSLLQSVAVCCSLLQYAPDALSTCASCPPKDARESNPGLRIAVTHAHNTQTTRTQQTHTQHTYHSHNTHAHARLTNHAHTQHTPEAHTTHTPRTP